jgi:hypothetical protein
MPKIAVQRCSTVVLLISSVLSLSSCGTVAQVELRTRESDFFRETPVGSLNLRTSPVRFKSKNQRSDITPQVSLLIDIVSDVQRSEPYERRGSSIAKIILGESANEFRFVFKNCQYLVITPRDDHAVRPGAETIETKRGEFAVVEAGVVAPCR